MPETPFSYKVTVASLPAEGLDLDLTPDEAQRAVLARHAGVLGVPRCAARLHVAPEGKAGAHVTGTLSAEVRQTCVVTLDPFESAIEEAIDVHFAPEGTFSPAGEEDEERDPPDPIVDGAMDVGALVAEFLALGIDPYPRRPGAVFEPPAEDPAAASPFSALSSLKGRR